MQSFYTLEDTQRDWVLSERQDSQGRTLIKVPIAFTGEWNHPQYGKVKLSEEDLIAMQRNWSNAQAGYDPPLFKGHPLNNDSLEGDASEGWPDSIYIEGDTLFGEYIPTDESLIADVQNKRYRYASAEIIHNAVDKTTGDKVGPLLVGVALTNRPYLPMKHRSIEVVNKFSDAAEPALLFSFDLLNQQESTMTTAVNTEAAGASILPADAAQQFSDQFNPIITKLSEENDTLKAHYKELAERFSELATEHSTALAEYSALKTQLSDLITRDKEREVQIKLDKLNKLNLPAERKQLFSDWIKEGILSDEAEAKLFADCQNESEKYGHIFTTAQGQSEETTTNKVEMPQIFSDIISRNQQVMEARRGATTLL